MRDEVMVERWYSGNPRLAKLMVEVDNVVLHNDQADEARVVCIFVDEYENRLYHYPQVVSVSMGGGTGLIGPSPIPSLGGYMAFRIRIRAGGTQGTTCIHIHTPGSEIDDQTVIIQLEREDEKSFQKPGSTSVVF